MKGSFVRCPIRNRLEVAILAFGVYLIQKMLISLMDDNQVLVKEASIAKYVCVLLLGENVLRASCRSPFRVAIAL